MTQVSVAFPESLVTQDLQVSLGLQASQEEVVLVLIVPAPQDFPEPRGQKERRATLAFQPMA